MPSTSDAAPSTTPPSTSSTKPVDAPSTSVLQSLTKFNRDLLCRYDEVMQQFQDKTLSPSQSTAFKSSIVEYLALVNQQYICYGTFRLPHDEAVDNPAEAKVESLKKQGFVVSSDSAREALSTRDSLSPEFANLPIVKHALDAGVDLNGEDDE